MSHKRALVDHFGDINGKYEDVASFRAEMPDLDPGVTDAQIQQMMNDDYKNVLKDREHKEQELAQAKQEAARERQRAADEHRMLEAERRNVEYERKRADNNVRNSIDYVPINGILRRPVYSSLLDYAPTSTYFERERLKREVKDELKQERKPRTRTKVVYKVKKVKTPVKRAKSKTKKKKGK